MSTLDAPERTCLLVADISGYTSYLAGVELDHAQDILADLMNTVVTSLRPGFKLSKLEGDAAFVYAPTESIDGSVLLDSVEGCYFAFRKRLLSIRQASSCQCNACSLIPSLDLKVVVHHGSVVHQRIAGRHELAGADVILVHRLLKNSIDLKAYAFLSNACVEATGLNPEALGMQRHEEEYEHIGRVSGWVEDLEWAWRMFQERKRFYIADKDATVSVSDFLPAPPQLVWEYISSPSLRPLWSAGMDRVDQQDATGRRRPGTVNHCVHGKDVYIQEFLDWRPPRYFTTRTNIPGIGPLLTTHEVEPVEGGSMLHQRIQRPKDKAAWAAFDELVQFMEGLHDTELERLTGLLVDALAGAHGDPEPDLPLPDETQRLATAVAS